MDGMASGTRGGRETVRFPHAPGSRGDYLTNWAGLDGLVVFLFGVGISPFHFLVSTIRIISCVTTSVEKDLASDQVHISHHHHGGQGGADTNGLMLP